MNAVIVMYIKTVLEQCVMAPRASIEMVDARIPDTESEIHDCLRFTGICLTSKGHKSINPS